MHRSALLLALLLVSTVAGAQLVPVDPDWQEADAPRPPPLRTQGLVPIDMGPGTDLRWGVDPASIRIGADRVVRYVVVAIGQGGAVNGIYEGVRCDTAEVRVYARHARDGDWVPARAEWKPLQGSAATLHSLVIARNGVCLGQAPNGTPAQIARDLGQTPDFRFRNEAR
ncbi:MAG: CNP1-like family protein [Ramlibacter sp.]